jgi:PAS domain-containing protein
VIVCSDDHALAFLLEHRTTLFPKVPVVFCGVNDYSERLLAGHERITGVIEAFDIRQTVDMALRLHPFCQKLIFVIDTQSRVIAWNQAMEDLTGISAETMIGKDVIWSATRRLPTLWALPRMISGAKRCMNCGQVKSPRNITAGTSN